MSNADEISKLKQLLDEGTITEKEFNKRKKQLLSSSSGTTKKSGGCLMKIISFIVFFTLTLLIVSTSLGGSIFGNNGADETLITLSEFNQIKTNMTYDEVKAIIGSDGKLLSESSIAGHSAEIFTWDGKGTIGSNASITFSNGKVMSKAQFGLE